LVLELPKEVVVSRGEGRALKQHGEDLVLKVVVCGHLAVTPEVLQLTVGESSEVVFHTIIIRHFSPFVKGG
jgi:hypothetical protein